MRVSSPGVNFCMGRGDIKQIEERSKANRGTEQRRQMEDTTNKPDPLQSEGARTTLPQRNDAKPRASGSEASDKEKDEGPTTEGTLGSEEEHRGYFTVKKVCGFTLKGVFILLGVPLACVVEVLLFIGIFFRADLGRRRGASFSHGVAFLAILIILLFILLCFTLKWHRFYHRKIKVDRDNNGVPEANNEETKDEEKSPEELEFEEDTASGCLKSASPSSAPKDSEPKEEIRFLLNKTKRLALFLFLPLTIVLLILTEIVFVLQMPRNSIIPLKSNQNALNPNSEYVPDGCDVQNRFNDAANFFNGSVNADDVMLVYVTWTMKKAAAFEADNTIYLPKKEYWCPPVWLLVHEFVHVYQEQTGYFYGPGGPGTAIRLLLDGQRCKRCLYDYGGREGLVVMMKMAQSGNETARDVSRAFGSEQQAEIVEHYYYLYRGICSSESGNATTDDTNEFYNGYVSDAEYCEALRFYSCQIINC